jgi:hypothetical protein
MSVGVQWSGVVREYPVVIITITARHSLGTVPGPLVKDDLHIFTIPFLGYKFD